MAIDLLPLLGWQPNFVVVSSVCKVKGDVNADFWHGSLLNVNLDKIIRLGQEIRLGRRDPTCEFNVELCVAVVLNWQENPTENNFWSTVGV